MAAGSDAKVVFYDTKGNVVQKFDYAHDKNEKEFTVAEFSPSGTSVAVGSYNRFRTFSLNPKREVWEESSAITVDNMYTVTSITWKRDGSRLLVGSLCGALDVYDACIRRYRYKGKFEMIFVSPSQVIVKRIANGKS
jgi:intraflagellar transport protein 172